MNAMIVLLAAVVGLVGCASEVDPPSKEEVPVDVEVDEDTTTPAYGSGYASNCFCSFCTRYCTVDGTTYKNGTCC